MFESNTLQTNTRNNDNAVNELNIAGVLAHELVRYKRKRTVKEL